MNSPQRSNYIPVVPVPPINTPPANFPVPPPKNNRTWIIVLAICLAVAGGIIVYLVVSQMSVARPVVNFTATATPAVTVTVTATPTLTASSASTPAVTATPVITPTPIMPGYDMTGRAMAPDGIFSVYVGTAMADKTFVDYLPSPGATASYNYCYRLSDASYDGGMCGLGRVPLFTITAYTASQLAMAQSEPMFMGQTFKEHAGLTYAFFHPNGDMPNEVLMAIPEPTIQDFYYTVMDSIIFHN